MVYQSVFPEFQLKEYIDDTEDFINIQLVRAIYHQFHIFPDINQDVHRVKY